MLRRTILGSSLCLGVIFAVSAYLPAADSTPLVQHAHAAFAPGLTLRDSRQSSLATAVCRGDSDRVRRVTTIMSAHDPLGGQQTRREALLLAIAAGTSALGAREAGAAGSIGPEKVDGDTTDKGAVRPQAPSRTRNKVLVSENKGGKEVKFPLDVKQLTAEYKKTESGLFYKVVKEGPPEGPTPKPGDTLELHYVGSVCSVDKDGEYDCDPGGGLSEIYPTLPQGIVRDSPRFDSSFARGRPMRVGYKKSQLSLGLEEAVSDMRPGGVKMVFLVPELSLACPPQRVCVADIEPDERMAFYLELVSINPTDVVKTAVGPRRELAKRKRLFGPGPPKTETPADAAAGTPAPAQPAPAAAPAVGAPAGPAPAPAAGAAK